MRYENSAKSLLYHNNLQFSLLFIYFMIRQFSKNFLITNLFSLNCDDQKSKTIIEDIFLDFCSIN